MTHLLAVVGVAELIPLLVFVGIVFGIWSVLSMISNRNSRALDRLQRLSRPQSLIDMEDPQKLQIQEKYQSLLDTAKAMSAPLMPQTELEQNALKIKLANAGFRSDAAPMVYSGVRFACLITFFLVSFILFVPGRPMTFRTFQWPVIFTGIGFYLPSIILWWLRRKRQEAIFLSLPDALDLLVVCVESGLGLDAAMRKVCDEMSDHAKVMCEEF